jgi:HNH endonuclease
VTGKIDNCYWERQARDGRTIDNGFIPSARRVEVNIRSSDYAFYFERCGRWRPSSIGIGSVVLKAALSRSGAPVQSCSRRRSPTAERRGSRWSASNAGPFAQIDHFVPVMGGGTNEPSNLYSACAFCKQSKNNRQLVDWVNRDAEYFQGERPL